MKKKVRLFSLLLVFVLLLSIPTTAGAAKTYKAKKVTSKQIVTEFKKSFKIHKIKDYKKGKNDSLVGEVNDYKSKTDFYDKRYNKYCTVEVFADAYDAAGRRAFLQLYQVIYNDDSTNMYVFRHKNIILRVTNAMPKSAALKYYRTLKSIVK
ncbi:MAG: hypothetical protein Q4B26_03845 [Eubacteriales bacterium]|nr:hypothetical protein [Eubacteriales bacterium]